MADDDQVGADLSCVTGNLLDGIPDQDLAAGSMAGLGEPLQAVGKDFLDTSAAPFPRPTRCRR